MQRNTYFDYSPPLILPNIKGHIDYYPFGSAMATRVYSSGTYRYGFNGKELEKESFTDAYDFGARIYDGRLGRFLSIDPKFKIFLWQSTYVFAINCPLRYIDVNGENPGDQVRKGEGPFAYAQRNGTTAHELAKNNPTKFKNYPTNGTLEEQNAYWKDNSGKNWQINPGDKLELGTNNSKKPIEAKNNSTNKTTTNSKKSTSTSNNNSGIDLGKTVAFLLRNSPTLQGIGLNPFYKADAIVGDIGLIIVGAETDAGGVFILSGPDAGKFFAFYEVAGGVAPEAGVGAELGRLDYIGNKSNFTGNDIYGQREKYFGSVNLSAISAFISIGVGVATSHDSETGELIITSAIQVGWGLSPPFVSGGYNTGNVIELGKPVPTTR